MFQRELRIDLEKLSFLRESLAPDDHFIPAQRQPPKSNSPVFVGPKHALYACGLANHSANCPDAPTGWIGHLEPKFSAYPLRKRNGGRDTNCDQRKNGVPHNVKSEFSKTCWSGLLQCNRCKQLSSRCRSRGPSDLVHVRRHRKTSSRRTEFGLLLQLSVNSREPCRPRSVHRNRKCGRRHWYRSTKSSHNPRCSQIPAPVRSPSPESPITPGQRFLHERFDAADAHGRRWLALRRTRAANRRDGHRR